jgi:hypothetical protein
LNEQELAKLPHCHFCKKPVGEGSRTKAPPGKRLYLCDNCLELLRAVVHDVFGGIFQDIADILSRPDEAWVEQLESWSYRESQL